MSLCHFPSHLSSRHVRTARLFVTVLLGLQALLWGGGSFIEAQAAAESLMRYSHVEDQSTTACPPIHSHLDCLICRNFASGAIPTRARNLLPLASLVTGTLPAPAAVTTSDGCCGPLGSRAPPTSTTSDRPIA